MKFENFAYRRLNAYIEAKSLTILVYGTLKKFPKEETYALCDQLRRAVVSIPSNIAEGCSRSSIKEQIHFYCCPIKLVSSYRHMLGYRSDDSRVTFFICKPPLFKQ